MNGIEPDEGEEEEGSDTEAEEEEEQVVGIEADEADDHVGI